MDGSSFEEFVSTSGSRLQATAYLLTQDRHAAEDLVQTALVKVWSAWHRIETDPAAYARRTLVTTYISWWRRRWTGEHPTASLPEHPLDLGAPDLDLRAALARLPHRQRTVLVLRYFEDLTEPQVADLMGTSVGTVKSQASKALASLGRDRALARHADGDQEVTR